MNCGTSIDCRILPDLHHVRESAANIHRHLIKLGYDPHQSREFEIILVEVLNNLVAHATRQKIHENIRLVVSCHRESVNAQIFDHSHGFIWNENPQLPGDDAESGRGLYLVHQLADSVQYFRNLEGNLLWIEKKLKPASPGESSGTDGTTPSATQLNINADSMDDSLPASGSEQDPDMNQEVLSALFGVIREISESRDSSPAVARRLLHRLCCLIESEWFMFFEVLPDRENFRLTASSIEEDRERIIENSFSLLVKQMLLSAHDHTWDEILRGEFPNEVFNNYLPSPYKWAHVCPVVIAGELFGVLTLGHRPSSGSIPPKHRRLIQIFSEFLAIQIQSRKAQESQIRSTVLKQELEIARNIQQALLPGKLPLDNYFEISVSCETAQKVGGDFFDIEHLSEGEFLIYIVDVMGKGIPAALFATICRTIFKYNKSHYRSPAHILSETNNYLFDDLCSVEMFITAQVLYLNAREKKAILANAGHPPLIIKSGNNPSVREVCPEGLPIGIYRDTFFEEQVIPLPANFDILMYTDGLTDTRDAENREYFGINGLKSWIGSNSDCHKAPHEVIRELKGFLRKFSTHNIQSDDQTIIAISERRTCPSPSS